MNKPIVFISCAGTNKESTLCALDIVRKEIVDNINHPWNDLKVMTFSVELETGTIGVTIIDE